MSTQLSNKLKWNADLLMLGESVDLNTDRVVEGYSKVRSLKYNNLGVTATDRHFSFQDGTEVLKKIEVRLDRSIESNQKDYRVRIKGVVYDIYRIYTREEDRVMELSLTHAD